MKRATWVFIALALVALANCQVKNEGLALGTNAGTASGGESGRGGLLDAEFTPVGTDGPSAGGMTGSGGSTALGGSAGMDGGQGPGGIITVDGATSPGGRTGSGGNTVSDGASATGGATSAGGSPVLECGSDLGGTAASGGRTGSGGVTGAGGSPSLDGASDTTSAQGVDTGTELASDTGTDVAIDTADTQGPDIPIGPPDTGDAADAPDDASVDSGPPLTLIWSDEFNGTANTGIDSTKWSYVTWDPGYVNNELQKYTSRLANVFEDGKGDLVIRGLNTTYAGNKYTSGRIESKGHFSFNSRMEVRAKLPAGTGSYPGIIMLGTSGTWPQSGELALMEQYGQYKSWFYVDAYAGTASGSGNTGSIKYTFPNDTTASSDFHIYSLDWYADHIVFQVDGIEITRTTFNKSSPFYTTPEYIVLDVALGGDMGGDIDDNAFPMDMVVDYVRVYSF